MKIRFMIFALMLGLSGMTTGLAQEPEVPKPPAEHAVLKKDVGTWEAEVTSFIPGAPPETAPGEEVNTMIGEFWIASNFNMGTVFNGQGIYGYDAERKKFVGSWVDSMSPHAMHMEGTWDAATRTMTMFSVGKDASGAEIKGKSVTVNSEDGNTRTFTMYSLVPDSKDEYVKNMEIKYTRKK